MGLLWVSIVALFLGPACITCLGRRQATVLALDAFVVVAMGGLVLLHILPHAVSDAGWPALLAAVVGMLTPVLIHGPVDACRSQASTPLLSLAVLAIGLHAFFDGVALVQHDAHGPSLAWAVVLHRVLEGLGIGWLVRPHYGRRGTLLVVGTIAIATAAGFSGGDVAMHYGLENIICIIQAAVAGSLLHVVLRHAPPPTPLPRQTFQWASGLGGLAGVALLVWFEMHPAEAGPHGTDLSRIDDLFYDLMPRGAQALVAAYALVALIHTVVPESSTQLLSRAGQRWMQAVRGGLAGIVMAVCSCGVIPLYRKIVREGATPAAALAFLVAAPALGFAALFLSWTFLGSALTCLRALCSLFLAIIAGIVVPQRAPAAAKTQHVANPQRDLCHNSTRHRLFDGLHYTLGEVLDHSGPWVLFGLALAIFVMSFVQEQWLATLQTYGIEVVVLACLGTPIYLSATAATWVAVALFAKGAGSGAVIAFLLTSSTISITTSSYLTREHGAPTGWLCTLWITGGAVLAGWGIDRIWPNLTPVFSPLNGAPPSLVAVCATCLIAALFFLSLLRQGVRAFIGQVALPNSWGTHSHHHTHGGR